ncbi:AAA family ATPase [Alkalicoccus daliensis]|uniref:Nuclease SbcCD subunit C n=1 Tax=Alkalicoccus daliensis TaxID=745820 RepID=A0A1H0HEP0_9BACI|nr:SMC family ATPase [Alkalicoccus daliensis]SDO17543.1 exonuclease SbcC [Alkalicoccus daliensis]
MKPLKIKMTAFGPYKKQEVIDFKDLQEHKLFVISGKTGAGKTSIFDAICFALYGDASGEDRSDIRSMRSHFADDDLHTSVEFEFELKSRIYRVFRQLPHVKEGNKSGTGEKYEFYEITDGKEVPLTDRFIVSQVNEKIQSIIGLTKDQFSQIVMLPQGEFRKLLTSETENKEEILRKIFKTSFYNKVVEHLNEKRKDVQKQFEGQKQTRDIHIENLKASLPQREESAFFLVLAQEHYNTHQIIDGLEKEISFYEQSKKEKLEVFQEKEDSAKKCEAQMLRAQEMNKRIDLLNEKVREKQQLEAQKEQFKEKEQQQKLAEKAAQLEVYEKQAVEIQEEYRSKKKQRDTAEKKCSDSQRKQQEAQAVFEQEEKNGAHREAATRELDRLETILPAVEELEGRKKKIRQLETEVDTFSKKAAAGEQEVQRAKEERTKLTEKLKPLEESIRSLPALTEKQGDLRADALILRDYLKRQKAKEEAEAEASGFKAVHDKEEAAFTQLEERWLNGQASILAADHLHDGKPCPVCGSEAHPNKAVLTEDIPTKDELDEKRRQKKQKEMDYTQAQAKLNAAADQLNEKKQEVIDAGYAPEKAKDDFQTIAQQGKKLGEEITQLKKDQESVDQLRETLQNTEKALEAKTEEQTKTVERLTELRSDYKTETSLYEQSLTAIPEELRALEQLKTKMQETKEKKQRLETQWEEAQKVRQQAQEQLLTAQSDLKHAEQQVQDTEAKKEKVQQEYENALEKAGFASEDAYKKAKLPADVREALQQEIEKYHTAVHTVSVQVKDLQEELKDKERVDVHSLQETLHALQQEMEEARTAFQKAAASLETAEQGKEKIAAAEMALADVEQEFQLVKDLYDVVRGENTKKISFERYLQIEFLEQIIHAANERLKRLSNGQYYLMRSARLEKRGRQSGLGLDVLDNYTGQMRDVKTLSGGEKFNASLCLALGMADIIQSYEGGISIETMFIDEGFGSLDEESLQKAIDTLVDLQQSGRMIGVISHVQEMKQVIPATLEVKKSKEGHSETKFVLN